MSYSQVPNENFVPLGVIRRVGNFVMQRVVDVGLPQVRALWVGVVRWHLSSEAAFALRVSYCHSFLRGMQRCENLEWRELLHSTSMKDSQERHIQLRESQIGSPLMSRQPYTQLSRLCAFRAR